MPSPIRIVLVLAAVAVVATLAAQEALCSANTTGSGVMIWPQPMKATNGTSYTCLSPLFNITFDESFVGLGLAVIRYTDLMLEQHQVNFESGCNGTDNNVLTSLNITVVSSNLTLTLGTDESYTLTVPVAGIASLNANTWFGALRGLESLSQMVAFDFDEQINFVTVGTPIVIADAPRFSHRGLLLDTARHFLPVTTIYRVLDSMSYAKLNVFHWHIVDAQSFPFQSRSFPDLWEGAWSKSERYTQTDVSAVIEYAYNLGIRVIPEFDSPGHAYSWGVGYPEVLPTNWSTCPNCANECIPMDYGDACDVPVDPSSNTTWDVVQGLYEELTGNAVFNKGNPVFVDEFVHMGGDEVSTACWNCSTTIQTFMTDNNISGLDALYGYYVRRANQIVIDLGRTPINWEEVFNFFNTTLPPQTVIEVWLDHATLARVVAAGYRGILANNNAWYLDHLTTNWTTMYMNEPFQNITDPTEQSLVLGGEVCMWGETVDTSDIGATIWPRAAAVAERLWSQQDVTDIDNAHARLYQFRCRLEQRGIEAAPVDVPGRYAPLQPGSCYTQ